MSNACGLWGTTRTATSRRARSVFVVVTVTVCALGAALGLGAPGRALASGEAPVADAPARAMTSPPDTPPPLWRFRLSARGTWPWPRSRSRRHRIPTRAATRTAQQLIAPFTEVLPSTCLGSLMEIFLGRMTAATAASQASPRRTSRMPKGQRLASKWRGCARAEVFWTRSSTS